MSIRFYALTNALGIILDILGLGFGVFAYPWLAVVSLCFFTSGLIFSLYLIRRDTNEHSTQD
jgi:hypothetical protein